MIRNIIATSVFLLLSAFVYGQEKETARDTMGYRLKQNGQDVLIYTDVDGKPDLNSFRKLNYRVYFRTVKRPTEIVNGKTYQMITVPGPHASDPLKARTVVNGSSISPDDFDKNFWIDVEDLRMVNIESFPFKSRPCFGVLSVPFKIRPERGEFSSTLLEGSFNVGAYFGWRIPMAKQKTYFICPVISAGFTTMNYTSANNREGINDPDKTESGSGMSYGTGLVFDIFDIQFGIVAGADHGFGNLSKTYTYQDAMWFSFSFNYNFLQQNEAQKNPDVNKARFLK